MYTRDIALVSHLSKRRGDFPSISVVRHDTKCSFCVSVASHSKNFGENVGSFFCEINLNIVLPSSRLCDFIPVMIQWGFHHFLKQRACAVRMCLTRPCGLLESGAGTKIPTCFQMQVRHCLMQRLCFVTFSLWCSFRSDFPIAGV